MDATTFAQGLTLSLIGMGITFAALGVLILVIVLLRWLFPVKASVQVEYPENGERERAVAVAAVWHYLRTKETSPTLGSRLDRPRGPWWYADKVNEE